MTFGWRKDGFALSLAQDAEDLRAVQALRYQVFVTELGGDGPGVDHRAQIETDRFDAHSDHMMLRDEASGAVIAAYRLLRRDQARAAGGFYSETEFDLSGLLSSGRPVLELGRSCVHAAYRGSAALFHVWSGLADYVRLHGVEVLFGTASFSSTDVQALSHPLSLLHHLYGAPAALRPRATPYQTMDLVPLERIDRRATMVALPPLLKAYLRLGGRVGEGAFVDHAFKCTDVCVVMDTQTLNDKYARHYRSEGAE